MPVKCSFCRRRFMCAGPYKTHLRKAHADLDIILASTLQNLPPNRIDDPRADIIDHNKPSERPDSDYESDPASDPTGYERDAINDLTYHSDTEALNDNTSSSAARQTHYESPEKQLETSMDLSKNAAICARTHGLHLLVRRVSNLHLGSLKVNLRSRRSLITLQIVSVTRHQLAIAPCIR